MSDAARPSRRTFRGGRTRGRTARLIRRYRVRVTRYRIQVKPGSRKGPLVEDGPDGLLTVYVTERAVEGAANDGVVAALAQHWGVRKRDVRIVSGHTARVKTVEIDE